MASVPRGSNKPLSTVHQHFDELPSNKVKCKRCPWTHHKNATRQAEHLKTHKEIVSQVDASEDGSQPDSSSVAAEVSSPDIEGSKKRKQPSMAEYVHRPLSSYEQANCQLKQVFSSIMNGHSYNSQVQPWHLAFLASLRRSYAAPSVRTMDSIVEQLHKNVTQLVDEAMVREGVCTLAFDGWTGPQHLPCLGVSAILPSGKNILLKLQVQQERETGENLAELKGLRVNKNPV